MRCSIFILPQDNYTLLPQSLLCIRQTFLPYQKLLQEEIKQAQHVAVLQNSYFSTTCFILESNNWFLSVFHGRMLFRSSEMSTTAKPAGCTPSLLHIGQINGGSVSKLILDSICNTFNSSFNLKTLRNHVYINQN